MRGNGEEEWTERSPPATVQQKSASLVVTFDPNLQEARMGGEVYPTICQRNFPGADVEAAGHPCVCADSP